MAAAELMVGDISMPGDAVGLYGEDGFELSCAAEMPLPWPTC
jgi:hypothetical protein